MGRFTSRPRADDGDEGAPWMRPLLPDIQVSDSDHVDTGLVDLHGNTIWRAPNPIGFGRDEEWD